MSDEEKLLPCPFCGDKAADGHVENPGADGDGGYFIQCTNPMCGASTNLRFAVKEDPRPLLREMWNTRASTLPARVAVTGTIEDLSNDDLIAAAMQRALDVWPSPLPSPNLMSDKLLCEILALQLQNYTTFWRGT